MQKKSRNSRMLAIGGVILGLTLGLTFWWGRPFDSYLLDRWAAELSTIPDDAVPARLEQIAALGDRSFPVLVSALHSDRPIVAEHASLVLQQQLGKLELRPSNETSRLVAGVAIELANYSDAPGPYSGPGSMWLATRILLWPIDRKLVDGERLVADCEAIIRSAKRPVADPWNDDDRQARRNSEAHERDLADLVPQVAGGGLPVQLTDAPSLPPQDVRIAGELHPVAIAEPQYFTPVQTPRVFDTRSITTAADDTKSQTIAKPPAVDSRQSLDLRRDASLAPPETTIRPNLQSMSDLDVMRKLSGDDEALTREAVDELYRRGFQTKHFRLAELLVDPDPAVRLQMVRSLPQMSGIDSRPWLLWLSRDPDPAVRQAAVSVIATSSDPVLQARVRGLEREETDEDVLQALRQILDRRPANSTR